MEAIFGAYKLIGAINNPRPEDVPAAPVLNQAGAGVAGGEGGGDGGDAGVGGVASNTTAPSCTCAAAGATRTHTRGGMG
jgi:hypothetical protein